MSSDEHCVSRQYLTNANKYSLPTYKKYQNKKKVRIKKFSLISWNYLKTKALENRFSSQKPLFRHLKHLKMWQKTLFY